MPCARSLVQSPRSIASLFDRSRMNRRFSTFSGSSKIMFGSRYRYSHYHWLAPGLYSRSNQTKGNTVDRVFAYCCLGRQRSLLPACCKSVVPSWLVQLRRVNSGVRECKPFNIHFFYHLIRSDTTQAHVNCSHKPPWIFVIEDAVHLPFVSLRNVLESRPSI